MNRLPHNNAVTIGDAIEEMLKVTKLASGLNVQRIFSVWDEVSGAGPFTIKKFFRDGKLYITTSSSVICSQLSFQKDALIEKMNAILAGDRLFIKDDPKTGYIKELILK